MFINVFSIIVKGPDYLFYYGAGLKQKILGIGLNKTRRNSNWEQRPLSHYQVGAFVFMIV